MSFKISKAEQARIDTLTALLTEKLEGLERMLDRVRSNVATELESINETREELRGVIEDIHRERTEEYDDKSDNWKSGDRGSATTTWLDKLEDAMNVVTDDFAVEIASIEVPEELSMLADEGLPLEPEY